MPPFITIRCLVACVDANGSPAFFKTTVEIAHARYEEGEHYEIAKARARKEGYETDRCIVYDENDGPPALFDALYPHVYVMTTDQKKTYIVKQYETYLASYRVEARSEGEAVLQILKDEKSAEQIGFADYLELDKRRGLPIDENQEIYAFLLADAEGDRPAFTNESIIETIHSVHEETNDATEDRPRQNAGVSD